MDIFFNRSETLDAKQIQSLFEKGVLPEPEEGDVKVNIQSKDETPETPCFV